MNRYLLGVAASLLISACATVGSSDTTADSTTSTTLAAVTQPPTTAEPIVTDDSPCLAGDKPFSAEGIISAFGTANGDAAQISGIRWAAHPGCERVVVDLLTADGAPAGAIDPVGVDYSSAQGVVRIKLPASVSRSSIADTLLDGELADRAYVVATEDGRLAIDIHVASGTTPSLRAYEVSSPSRIVVDLRGDQPAEEVRGTSTSSTVVLVSPIAGNAGTGFTVSGYVKGRSDEVLVSVLDSEGAQIAEQSVSVNGDSTIWREFSLELADLAPARMQLRVGLGSGPPAIVELDATDSDPIPPPEV